MAQSFRLYATGARRVVLGPSRYIAWLATFVLALTAFVGRSVGGSRSWLPLGAYAVQPIQFVQVLLIPCWAPLLSARGRLPCVRMRCLC